MAKTRRRHPTRKQRGGALENYTPLQKAVRDNDIQKVNDLLNNGANINEKTLKGMTPLSLAVLQNNDTMVDFLLQRGANINIQTNTGSTPIHLAVFYRLNNIVKLLIDRGANLYIVDSMGETALNLAININNNDAINLLLSHISVIELPKNTENLAGLEIEDNNIILNIPHGSKNGKKTYSSSYNKFLRQKSYVDMNPKINPETRENIYNPRYYKAKVSGGKRTRKNRRT